MEHSIDLIECWPRSADYPLHRQWLHDNRHLFNKVIIVFTETNQGHNYRPFVRGALEGENTIIIESPPLMPGEDWRNVGVNEALKVSDGKWVYFTEQDFFPTKGFWPITLNLMNEPNTVSVGVMEGPRLHPCSLLVLREVLDMTEKNFGIVPDTSDHFSLIAEDLESLATENPGFKSWVLATGLYHHMAGLSHNMRLVEEGQMPNHKVDEFEKYLNDCMEVNVVLPQEFRDLYNTFTRLNSVKS